MKIHKIIVGPLQTNCYLIHRSPSSMDCVIIDPGDEPEKIIAIS